jgi:hypothetical protein
MQSISETETVGFRRSTLRNGNARPQLPQLITNANPNPVPGSPKEITTLQQAPMEPSATIVRYLKRFPAGTNPISTHLAMVAQNSHKLTNKISAKTIRNRQYNRNSAINWMPEIMQSVSKAYMVAFGRSNLRNGNARPPTLPIATTQIQTRFQDHHRKLPHCSQHHTRRRKSTKTPTEPSATAVRYNKRFPARTNPISTVLGHGGSQNSQKIAK